MAKIDEILQQNRDCKIALYGLGTETERFLKEYGDGLSVVGLLDGFREEGEIYGYPIIPMQEAFDQGIHIVIVIARPGSCKAIAKRIGDACQEQGVLLFDVRGRDLLVKQNVSYDFCAFNGESRAELAKKIDQAVIVSFDLFDTLIMRKVLTYTDVFDLLERKLTEQGVYIPDFARLRLSSEKKLSKEYAPMLVDIYEDVLRHAGGSFLSAEELAQMEWEIDRSLMIPRNSVCEIFGNAISQGKRIVITTDSYYREEQIREILASFHIEEYETLLVSCEKGTSKTLKLYEYLLDMNGRSTLGILHIGDDETADIEYARRYGIDTYRIYSGLDLYDLLGGLGAEKEIVCLADRVKAGLFVSHMFNDPFVFEDGDRRLSVSDAFDIGYLFCAPMISDFSIWLRDRVKQEHIPQVLFCARDGFLVGRLYRRIDSNTKSFYFLASRTAAIRAGVEGDEDISYVDSMKYFGTEDDNLRVRFGIEKSDIRSGRNETILKRSGVLRQNYKKYIDKLGVESADAAMFDFVAKGTTQMYLQKLFEQHIKGFYFLQLEPEFMADKGLDIEPFYSNEEKNTSAIFDNYYILETMLTSPYPATEEFDEDGNPVYSSETRSEQDIRCFKRAQDGILAYFDDYIGVLPETERVQNKRLDEVFLSMVNSVRIEDEEFMSLTVEDPFFGRMTAITDVIG